ncbi:hypothetical protein RFI_10216 [Reticulomyxa filosa]|uniref:Uncharacterized protein n=1 Tax=Reticulomyxa filosa TaxID=46433 RepID=X6NLY6_RETFI|nr:hypothetical protein RFI_10216 [Reticulomyxa filosa]|eukprot:ETO26913.1 hypothetical protein RFI_10216 [Reticulomyxa filosa]
MVLIASVVEWIIHLHMHTNGKYKTITENNKHYMDLNGNDFSDHKDLVERVTELSRWMKEFFQESSVLNDIFLVGTIFKEETTVELSQRDLQNASHISRVEYGFQVFKYVIDMIANNVERISKDLHILDTEAIHDPFEILCKISLPLQSTVDSHGDDPAVWVNNSDASSSSNRTQHQLFFERYLKKNQLKFDMLEKYLEMVQKFDQQIEDNVFQETKTDLLAEEIRQREQIALRLGFPSLGKLSKLTLLWHSCSSDMQQKSALIKILTQLQRLFVQNMFGEEDKDQEPPVSHIYCYLEDKVQLLKKSVDILRKPNDVLEETHALLSDYFIHFPKHVLMLTPPPNAYETVAQTLLQDMKMYLTAEDRTDLVNIANTHPLLVHFFFNVTKGGGSIRPQNSVLSTHDFFIKKKKKEREMARLGSLSNWLCDGVKRMLKSVDSLYDRVYNYLCSQDANYARELERKVANLQTQLNKETPTKSSLKLKQKMKKPYNELGDNEQTNDTVQTQPNKRLHNCRLDTLVAMIETLLSQEHIPVITSNPNGVLYSNNNKKKSSLFFFPPMSNIYSYVYLYMCLCLLICMRIRVNVYVYVWRCMDDHCNDNTNKKGFLSAHTSCSYEKWSRNSKDMSKAKGNDSSGNEVPPHTDCSSDEEAATEQKKKQKPLTTSKPQQPDPPNKSSDLTILPHSQSFNATTIQPPQPQVQVTAGSFAIATPNAVQNIRKKYHMFSFLKKKLN